MALTGTLKDFGIADILQHVHMAAVVIIFLAEWVTRKQNDLAGVAFQMRKLG